MSDVLAVAEQRDGALRKVSSEVVTGARRLADALAARVDALVVAAGPVQGADQLGGFGADKVITLTNPSFGRYAPEGYARVIADRARAGGYRAVLFAASAGGRDLAPRVAARLGVALAQDITDLAFEGGAVTVIHPVYAGKALLKLKLTATPAVVSLRPNVFTPVQRPKAGRLAGGGGCRLAAARRSGGPDREDGEPHAVHRGGDLRRDPAPRRHAHLEGDRRD